MLGWVFLILIFLADDIFHFCWFVMRRKHHHFLQEIFWLREMFPAPPYVSFCDLDNLFWQVGCGLIFSDKFLVPWQRNFSRSFCVSIKWNVSWSLWPINVVLIGWISTEANGLYIDLNLEHFWSFVYLILMDTDLIVFNMITMKKNLTIFGAEYFSWLQSSSHLSLRLLLFFLFVFGGVGRLNIAKGSANPRVTPFKSPKHYWVS